MTWLRFSDGYRLDPIAEGSPQALVVLLHDLGASADILTPVAARWAKAVPATAFIALDGINEASCDLRALPALVGKAERAALDRATQRLEAMLEDQLRFWRLNPSRLVLVGFGYGGTVALRMVLHQGWNCAGILAFAAQVMRPLPRIVRVNSKVRLIECIADRHIDHGRLRDVVALLTARGIDTRGALLAGSALSDEAIRHGVAYLVELVATAQRGDRFRFGTAMLGSASGSGSQENTAGRR